MRPADLERLRASPSASARFLWRLIQLSQAETGETYPTLYDPLAIALVFRPDLIETSSGEVRVSLDPATRGQTKFTPAPGGSTSVGMKVNVESFLDLFLQRVTSSPGTR